MFCLAENNFTQGSLEELGEDGQREYWATLALRHCAGLGPRGRNKLFAFFGSACSAFEHARDWGLAGLSGQCAREFLTENWRKGAKAEWDAAKKAFVDILLWISPLYPEHLRNLPDAPDLLYYSGKLDLLTSPAVAVVGSRNASEDSLKVAHALASSLAASGIAIISGMAYGIDSKAHYAALEQVGSSIGVLGTGINVEYPASNKPLYAKMRQNGLLVSEFAPDTPPVGRNFPVRNRIISGLSLGVVVVEAALRSGSLVTARLALEQNREIFAVPGPVLSNRSLGCQNLMREGAHPVFSADDVLRNLQSALTDFNFHPVAQTRTDIEVTHNVRKQPRKISLKAEPPLPLSTPSKLPEQAEEEQEEVKASQEIAKTIAAGEPSELILACLRKRGAMHIDNIADIAGLPAAEVSSLLVFMEMLGQIRRLAGARYEAVN